MGLRLNGSTSGYVELNAPATAGTTTLELPTDSIKPGLVLVASASMSAISNASINNCFSSTYRDYRILISGTTSTTADIGLRLRAAGVDANSTQYTRQLVAATGTTVAALREANLDAFYNAARGNIYDAAGFVEVFQPNLSTNTIIHAYGGRDDYLQVAMGVYTVSTSFDGLTLFTNTGTFTGLVRVYGYRNSL